jgi:hypothetical protein
MTNSLWTTVRDDLRERREAKTHERVLRAELAGYSTPAEIEDLLATLDTAESSGEAVADAEVIRRILLNNLRTHYMYRAAPARTVAGL